MALTLKLLSCRQGLSTAPGSGHNHALMPITTATKGWLVKTLTFYNNSTVTGEGVTVHLMIREPSPVVYRTLWRNDGTLKANSGPLSGKKPLILEMDIALDLNFPDVLGVTLVSDSGGPTVDCVVTGVERDQ